jgi:hypothetical protein
VPQPAARHQNGQLSNVVSLYERWNLPAGGIGAGPGGSARSGRPRVRAITLTARRRCLEALGSDRCSSAATSVVARLGQVALR